MQQSPILASALTCPVCGVTTVESMPVDACLFFHECAGCHARLRPKPGDCCVFCSFGSVKCPSKQQPASCCVGTAHQPAEG
ncbi:MAG TPA: GDCCVxC domain-containing (seleno)protein [Casimicrobiaceae bacterium]